jgi:hypothetical protein
VTYFLRPDRMQDTPPPAPFPNVYFSPRVAVYAATIVLAVFVQQHSAAAVGGSLLAWLNTTLNIALIALFTILGSLQLCFALFGLMLGSSLTVLAFIARCRGDVGPRRLAAAGWQLPTRRQVIDYVLCLAILMATSLLLLAPLWLFLGL